MVRNEHILYFRLLDPRMVDSSTMFTRYVSEWATNLRAISLNVGVTNFGPPCIYHACYLDVREWRSTYIGSGLVELLDVDQEFVGSSPIC